MDPPRPTAAGAATTDVTDTFDLKELMSACIHLARRGGQIIAEEHAKGRLDAHNKKVSGDTRSVAEMAANEVLTVADGRAQDAIITGLRGMFPGLRIVGEEGDVPGEEPALLFADVPPLGHPFDVPPPLAASLTAADVCLWVDPLDGTKEFVMGNLASVSVLIGVALRDRPVAGVILQPFVGGAGGEVTYGAVGVGVFRDGVAVGAGAGPVVVEDVAYAPHAGTGGHDPVEQVVGVGGPPDTVVAMSGRHADDGGRLAVALGRIDPAPRVLPLNACGNKMLRVIRGEASAHLQGPGASRWDTCAGEALLLALGGVVTSLDGVPYQYTQDACYDNADGFVASMKPEVHSRLLEALRKR
eukprot:CAMPEP_0194273918 /NCGR_PEP_ID=MMETSP0169-20130528/7153_1 /TAXON_ID=218684 /ORGANISM="Corethron pennatum, Strain L29A3" /LENGTH=356 /DNA_ID=CAMNT_0039017003 /DNA_START=132 /DNA_END=1202 /DNA_ORIENTATION=-